MTDQLQRAEHAREVAVDMVRGLRHAGHIAYFAGGCVRDELLGEHPKDYDIATDATPDRVGQIFSGTRFVGASFGVVQVRRAGVAVEIATFRTDGSYSDKRRPDEVIFSTPLEDARRRDFTINAMFLDPIAPADPSQTKGLSSVRGRVIDLVDGLTCLRAGRIKAVGRAEDRLAEDHLRALRAIRFAARFGFEIETHTAHAISAHAHDLVGVSRERVGNEVLGMLAHSGRSRAVRLIGELGLRLPVLGVDVSSEEHNSDMLAHLHTDASAICALATWLIQLGPIDLTKGAPMTQSALVMGDDDIVVRRVRDSLCLSNDQKAGLAEVLAIVRNVLCFWPSMSRAQRKRLASVRIDSATSDMPGIAGGLLVVDAVDAENGLCRGMVVATDIHALAMDGIGLNPAPLVTGDDLVRAGHQPGPRFKRVLDDIYDAQLEGRVSTHHQALEMADRAI